MKYNYRGYWNTAVFMARDVRRTWRDGAPSRYGSLNLLRGDEGQRPSTLRAGLWMRRYIKALLLPVALTLAVRESLIGRVGRF